MDIEVKYCGLWILAEAKISSSSRRTIPNSNKYLGRMFCVLLITSLAHAFWLPPDYWITVYGDQHIEFGRTTAELISFPQANGYIGYWIDQNSPHHEAYGHVLSYPPEDQRRQSDREDGIRFCGKFADARANQSRNICGRFRLLAKKAGQVANPFEFVPSSVANPFLAVEYLDMQIAMVKLDDTRWVYGGARMAERLAFAAHTSSGPLIEISYEKMPRDYVERVRILQRSSAFPAGDLLNDSRAHSPPQLPPISATNAQEEKEKATTTDGTMLAAAGTTTGAAEGEETLGTSTTMSTPAAEGERSTAATATTSAVPADRRGADDGDDDADVAAKLDAAPVPQVEKEQGTMGTAEGNGGIGPDEALSTIGKQTTTEIPDTQLDEYEEVSGGGLDWGETERGGWGGGMEDEEKGEGEAEMQHGGTGKQRGEMHEHRHRRHRLGHGRGSMESSRKPI